MNVIARTAVVVGLLGSLSGLCDLPVSARAQPVPASVEIGTGATWYLGDLSTVNRGKPAVGLPHARTRVTFGMDRRWAGSLAFELGDYPRTGEPSLRYHPRWSGDGLPEPTPVYSSTWRYAGEAALRWYPSRFGRMRPFLSLGGYVMGGGSTDGFKGVHGFATGPSLGIGGEVSLTDGLALLLEQRTRAALPDGALDGFVGADRRAQQLPFDLTATLGVGIRIRIGESSGAGRPPPPTASESPSRATASEGTAPLRRITSTTRDSAGVGPLRREIVCERHREIAARLYRSGEFGGARDTVRVCIEDEAVSRYGRARALRLLALTHLAENDLRPAQGALIDLLELVPGYRADPSTDPPTFVQLLESTRSLMRRQHSRGPNDGEP